MPLLILGKLQVPKLPIMALNGKDFARLIRSLRSLVYKTIWQTDDVSFGSGRAVDLSNLSDCFGEVSGDCSCEFQILGFHSSLTRQLPDS